MEHPKDAKRVSGSEIICADCGKTPNRCGAQACESGVVKGFRRANSRISDDLLDRFAPRREISQRFLQSLSQTGNSGTGEEYPRERLAE